MPAFRQQARPPASTSHSCPYCEQLIVPESGTIEPPSPEVPTPPSVAPPQGSQSPPMHEEPGQQSDVVEHVLHEGTQAAAAQVYGGLPAGLGTHGAPLQQSALVAHAEPLLPHCGLAQRGTPTLSGLHAVFLLPRPAQQSWLALQEVVMSLQTSPFGVQPMCCVQ
jgi:hypothetical protein